MSAEVDNEAIQSLIQQLGHDTELDTRASDGPARTSAAAAALDAMAPSSSSLSVQRFEQLADMVRRGYSKQQLRNYLSLRAGKTPSQQWTKAQLAARILNDVWQVNIAPVNSAAEHVVENTIELSERDFFLVLGGNGRYVRQWSKSGARVTFNPVRLEITIASTQDTFEWIQATIWELENAIVATHFDLKEFSRVALVPPGALRLIQRLTDVWFGSLGSDSPAHTSEDIGESLTAYSIGRPDATTAARLLLWFVPLHKWQPTETIYDVGDDTVSRCGWRPFSDPETLTWLERPDQWARWEAVRTRSPIAIPPPQLCLLEPPRLAASDEHSENFRLEGDLKNQISQLVQKLVAANPALEGEQIALTATPGFVLHSSEGERPSGLPHAGLRRTFATSIPFVHRLAATLPQYSRDVAQEEPLLDVANQEHYTPSANQSDDLWEQLLQSDSSERVFATKRSELGGSNLRLAHIRLIPSPHESTPDGTNLSAAYPPIEIFALMGSGKESSRLISSEARMVAVPCEATQLLSLPNFRADLKLSLQRTRNIAMNDAALKFLQRCHMSPTKVFVPHTLMVEIMPGVEVSYRYRTSRMVVQSDLEFGGGLLQLVLGEGGMLGGRNLEASIVNHAESADTFNTNDAAAAALKAVDLIEAMPRYCT